MELKKISQYIYMPFVLLDFVNIIVHLQLYILSIDSFIAMCDQG